MKKYFNYNSLLEEYLNMPINESIKHSFNLSDNLKKNDIKKLRELMCNESYIDEKLLSESFLFGIINNKAKIVQYSNKYIMDDLLIIEDFLKKYPFSDFKKQLNKTYTISDKTKNKYIKKAQKKNIECLYGNYEIGSNILNYINDNSDYNLLGERYGLENHILNNLQFEDPDFIKSKLIIIMNFDYDIIEVYESIPYELLQKGTAKLEADSIYGCYFNDFNYQKFMEKINNR